MLNAVFNTRVPAKDADEKNDLKSEELKERENAGPYSE
jgi:hypothetical protein